MQQQTAVCSSSFHLILSFQGSLYGTAVQHLRCGREPSANHKAHKELKDLSNSHFGIIIAWRRL